MPTHNSSVPTAKVKGSQDSVSLCACDDLITQSQGNYFFFRREFVTYRLFTKVEALFYQDLINHATGKHSVKKQFDDQTYFLCTTSFLRTSLDWDSDTQKQFFKKFRKEGFVKTVKHGESQQRWVHICSSKVEKQLAALKLGEVEIPPRKPRGVNTPDESAGGKYPRRVGGIYPPKKKTIKKQQSQTPNGVLGTGGDDNSSCGKSSTSHQANPASTNGSLPVQSMERNIAARLYELVHRAGLLGVNGPHRKSAAAVVTTWAKQLRVLHGAYPEKDVCVYCQWYLDHFGEQHMPEAYSGKGIADKFPQIISAKRRSDNKTLGPEQAAQQRKRYIEETLPNGRVRMTYMED